MCAIYLISSSSIRLMEDEINKIVKNNPDFVYGDPNYIWNVLRYLQADDKGVILIEYDYKGETIKVELTNQNMLDKNEVDTYNNNLRRG